MNAPRPAAASPGHCASEERSSAPANQIVLVIPCFNEEERIGSLLEEVASLCPGCDVVVVDDGSRDGTSDCVTAPAVCLRHVTNLGIGAAVQTGIRFAQNEGYAFALQLDGDGQHRPDQVAELVAAFNETPANVIVGSRYIGPKSFQSSLARRFGGRTIGWTIQRLYGGQLITDPTSGMRLLDRKAIAFFAESYPPDYPEPISLAWALRAGLSVREVPIRMRARESGVSSIGGIRRASYMIRVISYIVLSRAIRRQ